MEYPPPNTQDPDEIVYHFVGIPHALDEDTIQLVKSFAEELALKLYNSQKKYDVTNEWLNDDWEEECYNQLYHHLDKGDPRDVAIYSAFMWKRGWKTSGKD